MLECKYNTYELIAHRSSLVYLPTSLTNHPNSDPSYFAHLPNFTFPQSSHIQTEGKPIDLFIHISTYSLNLQDINICP